MKYLNLVFFLFCINSFSQSISVNWSDKMKNNGDEVIVGGKYGNYYTRNVTKDNNVTFKTFDSKAVFKKETEADFKLGKKVEYTYVKNMMIGKNIINFLGEEKRKTKTFSVYASITNKDFVPQGETLVLSEVNEKSMVNYGIGMSPDSTKVYVWSQIKAEKKKNPNSIQYKIFDAGLKNLLSDKTVELPHDSKDSFVYDCLIDDYENFYVASEIMKSDDDQQREESETYTNITIYPKKGEIKKIPYTFKNKMIDSFMFQLTKSNTLVFTGFLSPIIKGFLKSKKRELVSDELAVVKIDCKTFAEKQNKVISASTLYPDKVSKVSEYVPFKVRNFYEQKDGSLSIVAEQYKSVYHSGYKGNGYYVYYYCDIAVINLDNKLDVKAMVKMPKFQKDVKNPSILSTTYKDKTYVIYEDETKNETAVTDKDVKKSTTSIFSKDNNNSLFLITVNAKGEMKKEIIYSYDKSPIRPNFYKCKTVKDGEIMLHADDYLGILKIK